MRIEARSSPNYNDRPAETPVSAIVIHADASHTSAATIDWLIRPESKVSYHYLIGRLGHVYQFVATGKRAWHCGKSELDGKRDVNDFSLGVCFSNRNDGKEPYTDEQYESGKELIRVLYARFPIMHVVTHAEIARPVGRKTDPGPLFDMERIRP